MPKTSDYWWGLPALLVGIVAMVAGDVGVARAVANGVFFLVGFGVVLSMRRLVMRLGLVAGCVLCGLLFGSLFGSGQEGVHRWVAVGPLSINVSMLLAPWLLAVVAHLVARERLRNAVGLAVAVQLAHLLQPDAAQAAAFGVGVVVLLLAGVDRPSGLVLTGVVAVLALTVATFSRRDTLVAVAEVEGIVGLARDAAPALGLVAVVACALLAVPFVRTALGRQARGSARAGHAALCAYVVVQVLAPVALAVPVPVMGFGAASVLAYAAAISANVAMPCDRPRRDDESETSPRSPSRRSS